MRKHTGFQLQEAAALPGGRENLAVRVRQNLNEAGTGDFATELHPFGTTDLTIYPDGSAAPIQ